jgi:chromosome segregation ATPase
MEPTVEEMQGTIEALNQRTADYDVQVAELTRQLRSMSDQIDSLNQAVLATADRDEWKAKADAAQAEVQRLGAAISSYLVGTADGQGIRVEYRKLILIAQRDAVTTELAKLGG